MLQFITDGTPLQVMSQIKSVVDNGVKWIQIRMKDASDCDIRNVIQMSKPLCHERGVTLVIDDRVDLAYEFDLDGVHLGKDDMHPAIAPLTATPQAPADIKGPISATFIPPITTTGILMPFSSIVLNIDMIPSNPNTGARRFLVVVYLNGPSPI